MAQQHNTRCGCLEGEDGSKQRTHPRSDGVRHPERHEAVMAVSCEVVRLVQEAEGGAFLEDVRGTERVVEAT